MGIEGSRRKYMPLSAKWLVCGDFELEELFSRGNFMCDYFVAEAIMGIMGLFYACLDIIAYS